MEVINWTCDMDMDTEECIGDWQTMRCILCDKKWAPHTRTYHKTGGVKVALNATIKGNITETQDLLNKEVQVDDVVTEDGRKVLKAPLPIVSAECPLWCPPGEIVIRCVGSWYDKELDERGKNHDQHRPH